MRKYGEVAINCECGCSIVRVTDLDEELSVNFYVSTFSAKQPGPFRIIRNRLILMWYALCGKEYLLHEIIVSKDQFKQFAKEVESNL